MPRLRALNKHWNKFPPVHKLVAMYMLGDKKTEPSQPIAQPVVSPLRATPEPFNPELEQLLKSLPQRPFPKPVLKEPAHGN